MFIFSFLRKNLKLRAQRNEASRLLTRIRKNNNYDDQTEWVEQNLTHNDWKIRNIAVKLVGLCNYVGFEPAVRSMIVDLKQPGFIRRNGIKTLRTLGFSENSTPPEIISALNDPYWEVRTEAALWLYENGIPDNKLSKHLIRNLYRKDINQIKSYPIFLPGRIYKEKNFEVRAALLLALGTVLNDISLVHALHISLYEDIWKVRESALIGFINAHTRLSNSNEDLDRILSGFDQTCTDFVPLFPIQKTYIQLAEKISSTRKSKS